MNQHLSTPWSTSSEVLAQELGTDLNQGLCDPAVDSLRARWGSNRIAEADHPHPVFLFLRQFADLMIGLLVVAATISGLIGEWTDTILIGLIVVINAVIGFLQEWKADRAVEALKNLSQPLARVRRNGQLTQLPSEALVPGDVIEINAGDVVPADARIVSAVLLEVDESPLTGESLPVEKSSQKDLPNTVLADRQSMIHSGTAVAQGHGRALVVETGQRTEIGHIANLLDSTEERKTPLQRRLATMIRWISIAVVVASLVIFAAGVLREPISSWTRELYSQMLLIAISLAVAAIPEGLPAIITVTLALGSQRMVRRKAITRRLTAVESLGSVDVICSDKTGTLTQNKMVVADVHPVETDNGAETRLLEAMTLCSDAEAGPSGEIVGSATETALLTAAIEHRIDVLKHRQDNPRIAETPFSSERKRMATVHKEPDQQQRLYVKGAPDRVLPLCLSNDDTNIDQWLQKVEELARSGRRVLSVATRLIQSDGEASSPLDESSLQLIGIVGIVDPVRPEAREAITVCKSAGIRTIMITGDHPGTAMAVGADLNLFDDLDEVVTGVELEEMTDEELIERVQTIACYARVSPKHKLRIVRALQSHGGSIAMTGDGVNDAPALKQADVGVAMGIAGTDVSKEAADIVLADDNFSTIVAAVEEGRIVYDNIRKFVAYLLTANTSEVLVILGAVLLGLPMPLLPVHLLWINLVTDGLPALALGFEPAERNVMKRPPRSSTESLFGSGLGLGILLVGILMSVTCLGVFFALISDSMRGVSLTKARTMTFFVLSVSQLFYVCGIRSFTDSFIRLGLWSNYRLTLAVIFGILLQLCTLYVPFLQKFFHTVPLSITELFFAIGISTIPFFAVEAWKVFSQISRAPKSIRSQSAAVL